MTVVALTADRAVAARITTYRVTGAPFYRIPAGVLIDPVDVTVRVIDGLAELELAGPEMDSRTLDPAFPGRRLGCRLPVELAPDWAAELITAQRPAT